MKLTGMSAEQKKERSRELSRAWNHANPERCRESARRRTERANADPELRAKLTEASDRSRYKRMYGITKVERDAAITAQGNKCLICDAPDPWHTDHNHSTGKFRGMLCASCNILCGQIEVSAERHRRALDYLAKHAGEPATMSIAA